MRVKALKLGTYNNHLHERGDIFDISDEKIQVLDGAGKPAKDENGELVTKTWFTPSWMVRVDDHGHPIDESGHRVNDRGERVDENGKKISEKDHSWNPFHKDPKPEVTQ